MKYSITKIKAHLWGKMVFLTRNTIFYPYIYRSYWHSLCFPAKKIGGSEGLYFAAKPNPGAGIGHQMANWIAGYWWAKQFGLKFAHIPFPSQQWDSLLGFGEDEAKLDDLLRDGYWKVTLPLFDEKNKNELNRIQRIISSYSGRNIVFICEGDQGYISQYGVMADIQRKFYAAASRKQNNLIYSTDCYNIAIHVRRGDIVIGQENKNPNLLMRWQNNDYFTNVLANVLKILTTDKPIFIYLFSQGIESDFGDFNQFPNLHFCLDMNASDSFLHMVYADLLITSKSSFSYKPALLNKGIKVCPKDFWHAYPDSKDWILADENGHIGINN